MQKEAIKSEIEDNIAPKTHSSHVSVLLHEAINALELKKGDKVLDCTINGGGHSKLIAGEIGKSGLLIGIDEDSFALERAKKNLSSFEGHLELFEGNFRNLDLALIEAEVEEVNKIIFDLGISSDQLIASGRGFSFKKDEPLLMTLSAIPRLGQKTALEVVNGTTEEELADIIWKYGEERFSRKIAKGIVLARKKEIITTSKALSDAVERSVPPFYRKGRIHPATKTFQAIRIAVNDELGTLEEGLLKAKNSLSVGGKMVVITFHSLEDRIVKNLFRSFALGGNFKIETKKPITPSREETISNPRSRSAKLRIIRRIR